MSIKILTMAWDVSLPPIDKLNLLALADYANDSGAAWPSIATLSNKTGCSSRTVQRSIRSLVEQGHVSRVETPGKSCRYSVHPQWNGPSNPCQNDTPDDPAPRHSDTPPPSECHPTPVTVTEDPRQSDTQTVIEPSGKPSGTFNFEKPATGKHTIPDKWQPLRFGSESKAQAIIDDWSGDELATQVEHFTAHHRAKGSKFLNWQDPWCTWVINSEKFASPRARDRDNRDAFARAIDRFGGFDERGF